MENTIIDLLHSQAKPAFFRMYRKDVGKFVYVMLVSNNLLVSITGELAKKNETTKRVERWALMSVIDGERHLVNELKDLNTKVGIWELEFFDEVRFMADVAGYLHPLFRHQFFNLLQNFLNHENERLRKVLP